jgi:hypothetical protein
MAGQRQVKDFSGFRTYFKNHSHMGADREIGGQLGPDTRTNQRTALIILNYGE